MKWLGRRLTSDLGVILLMILSPALVYYGMWRTISSSWPLDISSNERLVPCGNTNIPENVISSANAFFTKLSSLQEGAFSSALHWGLFAVFFLSGAFVVYSFGRAISTGDIINIIPLLGSKGGPLLSISRFSCSTPFSSPALWPSLLRYYLIRMPFLLSLKL
ncbi:hypothetical protein [Thermococcus sp. AM4]|uniref:hypothetical protein n=1 Tax=Thermococcus sp. (strain AM4) TaxID=246969 RepID=UPI0011D26D06|nr:hypothetical protein [Thermococcus sp. AM4]